MNELKLRAAGCLDGMYNAGTVVIDSATKIGGQLSGNAKVVALYVWDAVSACFSTITGFVTKYLGLAKDGALSILGKGREIVGALPRSAQIGVALAILGTAILSAFLCRSQAAPASAVVNPQPPAPVNNNPTPTPVAANAGPVPAAEPAIEPPAVVNAAREPAIEPSPANIEHPEPVNVREAAAQLNNGAEDPENPNRLNVNDRTPARQHPPVQTPNMQPGALAPLNPGSPQ